jgi:hypothetical protein
VYFYHPHHLYHLYHHNLYVPLNHDLHHDLKSTLGKGQNNAHEDGQPSQSYHIELVLIEIHQPKSVHHFLVDNPFDMNTTTCPTRLSLLLTSE